MLHKTSRWRVSLRSSYPRQTDVLVADKSNKHSSAVDLSRFMISAIETGGLLDIGGCERKHSEPLLNVEQRH